MEKLYVIVDRDNGKLLTGHRQIRLMFGGGKALDGVFSYPNKRAPVVFKTRKNAEEHIQKLFTDVPYMYVRVANSRDLRRVKHGN